MLFFNDFNLVLVRHGQSTTNQNPDLMGQTADTPLSDNGKQQAAKLNARLKKDTEGISKIDYVWSSTYTRAYDTAEIALEGLSHDGIKLAEELREYDAGGWLGASRAETLTLEVKNRMGAMANGFLPPNGESLHQVQRRASSWLEENILYNKDVEEKSREAKQDGRGPLNIYLFTHGMTIKCLLHYVMGFDQSFTWKVMIENTSLTKLHFGQDGWRLLGINDFSHLT